MLDLDKNILDVIFIIVIWWNIFELITFFSVTALRKSFRLDLPESDPVSITDFTYILVILPTAVYHQLSMISSK